jgi:phosphatidate cytidylyltransferase
VKRVLTAIILVPIVVLALFRAPLWLFALLVLGVALLAAREYFDIAEKTGFRPMRGWGYASVALTFLFITALAALGLDVHVGPAAFPTASGYLFLAWPVFALLVPLFFLMMALRQEPLSQAMSSACITYMAVPYIGLTLVVLPLLRNTRFGALYLLYLMLLVWCGDIAAYYVGRAIGKHKLAPRVSPGKTWEGAIASVLAAIVMALILFREIIPITQALAACHVIPQVKFDPSLMIPIEPPLSAAARPFTVPSWFACLFGLCVNVAAQFGDLVESALKRGAGMKDSGTLLPGHGGILDRIDALLFALPIGFFFQAIMR